MTSIVLNLPEDLHSKMIKHNEQNWNLVIRNIIEERLKDLERAENIAKNSKLTEKEAWEISDKIEKEAWEKLKEKMK